MLLTAALTALAVSWRFWRHCGSQFVPCFVFFVRVSRRPCSVPGTVKLSRFHCNRSRWLLEMFAGTQVACHMFGLRKGCWRSAVWTVRFMFDICLLSSSAAGLSHQATCERMCVGGSKRQMMLPERGGETERRESDDVGGNHRLVSHVWCLRGRRRKDDHIDAPNPVSNYRCKK